MSLIIIEPECKGWNHEQVNIAWIKMMRETFPDEEITFYAEEGHLSAVMKKTNNLSIEFKIIELPEKSGDSMEYVRYYKTLFSGILSQNVEKKNNKILLLSSHKGNMKAILQLADTWRNCEFYLVLHAVVEQLIKKYSIRTRIRGDNFYSGWMLRKIMNQLACKENVKFATFSPTLSKVLEGKLQKATLDKISFIHHPYDYKRMDEKVHDGMVNIGVMGATVNNLAIKVMEEVGYRTSRENYVFTVIRSKQDFSKIRNVNLINEGKPVSREQMDEECCKMDYLLIPYDSQMYRLSASGVFFDSINYEISTIMLDSPLLVFYNEKYGLGKCFATVEEMINDIVCKIEANIELSKEEQGKICITKEILENENKQYLRNFMSV